MPPATRKQCDYPGCASGEPNEEGIRAIYITPEGPATRADVNTDLMQHVEIAHTLQIKLLEAQRDADRAKANRAKAEADKLREKRLLKPQTLLLVNVMANRRLNPYQGLPLTKESQRVTGVSSPTNGTATS